MSFSVCEAVTIRASSNCFRAESTAQLFLRNTEGEIVTRVLGTYTDEVVGAGGIEPPTPRV